MRVLVLSDIHANLAALDAVLDDAKAFEFETVWCLGDTVGYGPEPDQCIARMRLLKPRTVVGTISMDSFAVTLDRELPVGTPVTLIGDGVLADDHARIAGTIGYEIVCGIDSSPRRARRTVVDA